LSIVVVNYCRWDLTRNCLASIAEACKGITHEVFLIDNASKEDHCDAIAKEFPNVTVRRMQENLGFAKGNNVGLRLSKGRYAMLLNNDTVCFPESLTKAVRFMDSHAKAGVGGCKLLDVKGAPQQTGRSFPSFATALFSSKSLFSRIFPKNRFSTGYLLTDWDRTTDRAVDWVSGAALIIRREAMDQVGLLDEDYFMYCEDTDWCYRVKKAGWEVYFIADSPIHHIGGVGGEAKQPLRILYHHQSIRKFYLKHWHRSFLCDILVTLSIWIRCAVLVIIAVIGGFFRAG